jgi:hypothetical protein
MSCTDFILEAVRAELESHRAEIDRYGTRSITVCVKLNAENGKPRAVTFSSETWKDLTRPIVAATV